MAELLFTIVSPTAGTAVGPTVTVTASVDATHPSEYPRYRIDFVAVQFGASGPVVPGTRPRRGSTWQATSTLPAGTAGGTQLMLIAIASGVRIDLVGGTPNDPDLEETPITEFADVTVVTEATFPAVGFDPYPHDVTVASPPLKLALTGTAVDVGSGVTKVEFALDGGAPAAARNVSGDWGRWAVDLELGRGDHTLQAKATDGFGNVGSWQDTITVKVPIKPGAVEQAFGTTRYLEELAGMASRYLRRDGSNSGPDVEELGTWLRQPLARLIKPSEFAAATADVAQARVAIEVLRGVLTPAAPKSLDQRYRALAYEVLLRELGTSSEELRLSRVAEPPARVALADRLGIELGGSRPDHLDAITIAPDAITNTQLAQLFGYRSTSASNPLATPEPAALALWQQDALQAAWLRADAAERDGAAGPLPVIDPDVIVEAHLRSQDEADHARRLWTRRRAWIADRLEEIERLLDQVGTTAESFDKALHDAGLTIDLVALEQRDRDGEDISAELAALGLTLVAFRYLVRIRTLVTAGSVTASEWEAVASILVEVRKRRAFAGWRLEERQDGIVLQPGTFVADVAADPVAFTGARRWRADWATLAGWRRTLIARGRQAGDTEAGHRAAIDAAEREALPALRDALLTELGRRATPRQSLPQMAERLSRELSLDFKSAPGTRTTRVGQAIDSLQSLLVSVRSGRLSTVSGTAVRVDDEAAFDLEWAWLETYARWRSAVEAFAYPDNRLLPSLFVPDFVASDRHLAPTKAFLDLMSGLFTRPRLTPAEAIDRAETYLAAVKAETGQELKDVRLTSARTNAELDAYRELCARLCSGSTEERQIAQHLREIFWLVPIALARKLHDGGHYAAALDWYQSAFAYQLPAAQRFIYRGLALEQSTPSVWGRHPSWLAFVKELNPHFTARHRKGAYTRFTLLSIVECFLAFADSEFARTAHDANARARALYQTASDLLALPEAIPETGPDVPYPVNPVWRSLKARAETGLSKIHAGLNIAGQAEVALNGNGNVLPSIYRYGVVVERAKTLVAIAQQVESAYLSALERADAETYAQLQANHDLRAAHGTLAAQSLRVDAAFTGIGQAELQRDRAQAQYGAYDAWIGGGLNMHEEATLRALDNAVGLQDAATVLYALKTVVDSTKAGFSFGLLGDPAGSAAQALSALAGAESTRGQLNQTKAGFERREQEWQLNRNLADKDVQLANNQIAAARVQHQIAAQERLVAAEQLNHAQMVAEFLAGKFTNAALYEWMSGVLARVYAFFLQQATGVARLAQAQLAFERQEPVDGYIAADYWQPAADQNGNGADADRRGMTGSARLLGDLYRLDQQAFDTDRRKLHLRQTVVVSRIAGFELQRFRDTGVLTFATPEELFDRDFPGHYLRLIKSVKVSLVALVPPERGVRATLAASGVSRTVVARQSFDTVTLRREPESIAFTGPIGATGLFELESEGNMLLPFEGMGVDTVWQLTLPKAANPIDYRTIADVLLTIEYSALDSPEHRQNVIRSLDAEFDGECSLSVRNQFPDVWYELNNPDTVEDPAGRMRAILPLTADDFPRHVAGLAVRHVTLFVVRDDSFAGELTITALRHTTAGQTTTAGPVHTVGGVAGTRRPGAAPWRVFVGTAPVGDWELQFEDTPEVRSWFTEGVVEDLVVMFTLSGTAPPWP